MSATLEVLSRLSQVSMAHQVLTVLELAALLKEALGASLGREVRVSVLRVGHDLRHVIPVDLELGDAGLLSEDMARQALDDRGRGRLLVQLRSIILNVDVVADAEEFLAVLVAARKEHGCDAHNVANRKTAVVRGVTLKILQVQ